LAIYVIGELNPDMIISGSDIVPEWNKEKLIDSFAVALGSSSAITACALAGLGAEVRFVSVAGDDDLGSFCARKLQDKGVDTTHVTLDSSLRTGVTLSFSTPKDRGLVTYLGSIASLTPAYIPPDIYEQATHIHFGSFFLQDGMREHWAELFRQARSRGISTSFDTGWDIHDRWHKERISELLAHTDLFIPSEDEFLRIYEANELEEARKLLPDARQSVIVKRGARGSVLIGPDGTMTEAEAYRVTPVDTTGAGDSFNAGAIYGYLAGQRGAELLAFANACGALSTQRIGGAEVVSSLAEVRHFQAAERAAK